MPNGVILDNWSLQDIGECLANGLSLDYASEIAIDLDRDTHSFRDVSHAGVQIEALLDFLVDIVLQDSIYVDSAFTGTWQENEGFFMPVIESGLLQRVPFLGYETTLVRPREIVVSDLCVTKSLKRAQQDNEESWRLHGNAANRYMSALVWGTAGMLSRSHIFEAPYHPCPARKRLLEHTAIINPRRDAEREVMDWIDTERLRIFQIRSNHGTTRRATIVLPPIAVEIINEAYKPADLIPIAYQKRDQFRKVREWLKEIQHGLDTDSAEPAVKFAKTLGAISRDLDAQLSTREGSPVSVELSYGYPKVHIDVSIMSGVRKRFGVSAVLNRMLMADQGTHALKHLLGLFGERGHAMELAVQGYIGNTLRSANVQGRPK